MGFPLPLTQPVSVTESLDVYILELDKNTPLGASFDAFLFPVGSAEQRDYLLRRGDGDLGVLTAYDALHGWEAAAVGRRPPALDAFRPRHTVLDSHAGITGPISAGDFAEVRVPVFNTTFLLYRTPSAKLLIPLQPDPRLPSGTCGAGVMRGVAVDADCLFRSPSYRRGGRPAPCRRRSPRVARGRRWRRASW